MEVGAVIWTFHQGDWRKCQIHSISLDKKILTCWLVKTNTISYSSLCVSSTSYSSETSSCPLQQEQQEQEPDSIDSTFFFNVKSEDARLCNPIGSLEDEVDDLSLLNHLTEPTVLHSIDLRFQKGLVYTSSGSILLAVNPFRKLDIYDDGTMEMYNEYGKSLSKYDSKSHSRKGSLPPHPYLVADRAFRCMLSEEEPCNQMILVSGESGAGKTETTKIIMKYLATVSQEQQNSKSRNPGNERNPGNSNRVLQSNPILESFGNAKTMRNDNSSRFGKLIKIGFHSSGQLLGATLQTYLLEKVRVVEQCQRERNYHIFYELCAGVQSEENEMFQLNDSCTFHYLSQGGCWLRGDGVDDRDQYLKTRKAMDEIGMSLTEQQGVLGIVAAILHMGNIEMDEGMDGYSCTKDSEISIKAMKNASNLLGIAYEDLQSSLCYKTIQAGMEIIQVKLCKLQAYETRNTFVKSLYCCLFEWLVQRINVSLAFTTCNSSKDLFLGVIDIFGFEVFSSNSLEQFCINYANEKIQQFFGDYVFKMEQEVYVNEGIPWQYIPHPDNSECIQLIENRNHGIFSLLDEQCLVPQGSDKSFACRMYSSYIHSSNSFQGSFQGSSSQGSSSQGSSFQGSFQGSFHASKICQVRGLFTIKHYSGNVCYDTKGFCAKNKENSTPFGFVLLEKSSHSFIQNLVIKNSYCTWDTKTPTTTHKTPTKTPTKTSTKTRQSSLSFLSSNPPPSQTPSQTSSRLIQSNERSSSWTSTRSYSWSSSSLPRSSSTSTRNLRKQPLERRSSLLNSTVTSQFKSQLGNLLDLIKSTNPHFIRCIKPNDTCSSVILDRPRVLEQLRCSGILQAVQITRAGYPVRLSHANFVNTYSIFLTSLHHSSKNDLQQCCQSILLYIQQNILSPFISSGASSNSTFPTFPNSTFPTFPNSPPATPNSPPNSPPPPYQLGRSLVFLTLATFEQIERERIGLWEKKVLVIQCVWRGHLGRRLAFQRHVALLTIQRNVHLYIMRCRRFKRNQAACCIQQKYRDYRVQCDLQTFNSIQIQKIVRGFLTRCRILAFMKGSPSPSHSVDNMQEETLPEERERSTFTISTSSSSSYSCNQTTRISNTLNLKGEYDIQWEKGLLGIYFESDVSSGFPIVRRVHESLSTCVDIYKVGTGDLLLSIGEVRVENEPIQQVLSILQSIVKPITLKFGRSIASSRRSAFDALSHDEYEVLWNDGEPLGLGLKPNLVMEYPYISRSTGNSNLPGMHNVQIGDFLTYIDDFSTKGVKFDQIMSLLENSPRPLVLRFLCSDPMKKCKVVSNPQDDELRFSRLSQISLSSRLEGSLYNLTWCEDDGPLGIVVKQAVTSYYPTVTRVKASGVAVDGKHRVIVGDVLLFVNNSNISKIGFKSAMRLLQYGPKPILLTFQRNTSTV